MHRSISNEFESDQSRRQKVKLYFSSYGSL